MKSGIELIAEERQEQLTKHNWSLKHDQHHSGGELAKVAATLACMHTDALVIDPAGFIEDNEDPWVLCDRLKNDTIHALKVAGALIAAEIDRLNVD